MKKIGRTGTKTLWIAHAAIVAVWTGSVAAMLALAVSAVGAPSVVALAAWRSMDAIDAFVPFVSLGTALLGVVYGVWTPWGFVRHRWVAVKWVLALGVMFTGAIVIDRLKGECVRLAASGASATSIDGAARVLALAVAGQLVALLIALAISHLKPWRAKRGGSPA